MYLHTSPGMMIIGILSLNQKKQISNEEIRDILYWNIPKYQHNDKKKPQRKYSFIPHIIPSRKIHK
jgi:hypothetical protein